MSNPSLCKSDKAHFFQLSINALDSSQRWPLVPRQILVLRETNVFVRLCKAATPSAIDASLQSKEYVFFHAGLEMHGSAQVQA